MMPTRNETVSMILDLASEQGFTIKDLGEKVQIYPKHSGPIQVFYFRDGDIRDKQNNLAKARRLGIKLEDPVKVIKKAKRTETKEPEMLSKPNGLTPQPPIESSPANRFDDIRRKLNIILNMVAEVEQDISAIERDNEQMSKLKTLLRQVL